MDQMFDDGSWWPLRNGNIRDTDLRDLLKLYRGRTWTRCMGGHWTTFDRSLVRHGQGEHGLLAQGGVTGVPHTWGHEGLRGHQGLGLEHGRQHLDTVNSHGDLS